MRQSISYVSFQVRGSGSRKVALTDCGISPRRSGTVAVFFCSRRLKCDGTRAEIGFHLSAKWTSPFKSSGASVQSTTGSRVVRISGSNAGYTMFRGSVKGTGYSHHSPVSPSVPLPCVTVCHHISTELYRNMQRFPVYRTVVLLMAGQSGEQCALCFACLERVVIILHLF